VREILQILAQIDIPIAGGWATVVFGYGPLGVSCWWLSRLVEKMRVELQGRDILVREITDKQVEALAKVTHNIGSLSKALVYNAATHGGANIRHLAQKELARMTAKDT